MSQDITFEKLFTIEDVENKTSIKVEYEKGKYWLSKNGSVICVTTNLSSDEDIQKLKDEGYSIETEIEDGYEYTRAIKGDDRILLFLDKGKKTFVDEITRYGMNELWEILKELVITFQTKFITDEEEEMMWHDPTIDVDKLYTETTLKYGFEIKNGIISVNE